MTDSSPKRGKPKGAVDKVPRVRQFRKLRREPEAFKAYKQYLQLEKEYKRLEKISQVYPDSKSYRKMHRKLLHKIRDKQCALYDIIARNDLSTKLATELGISRLGLYMRTRYSRQRKDKRSGKKTKNTTSTRHLNE